MSAATSRAPSPIELAVVVAGSAFFIAAVCLVARWQARVRFDGWADALGGKLGWYKLRIRHGSLEFGASAQPFGALEMTCRRCRTGRPLKLRTVAERRWPHVRSGSTDADLDARLHMSAAIRGAIASSADLQRQILDLTERLRLSVRFGPEGLRATLRPRERDIDTEVYSKTIEVVAGLYEQLALVDDPTHADGAPRTASGKMRIALRAVFIMVALFAPFALALRVFLLLTSGDLARVLWHSVPVAFALVVPLILFAHSREPETRQTPDRRAALLIRWVPVGWIVVASMMIALNHHLDRSPPVAHEVELLEVDRGGKHPMIMVRAWTEGRDTERLPLPNWLEPQLTPEVHEVLVEVKAGALGYEHVAALGVPGR